MGGEGNTHLLPGPSHNVVLWPVLNQNHMEDKARDQSQRPGAPMQTESFRKERPTIVGDEAPEPPFPIKMSGEVQHGFKRGSRELGCHTGTSWQGLR